MRVGPRSRSAPLVGFDRLPSGSRATARSRDDRMSGRGTTSLPGDSTTQVSASHTSARRRSTAGRRSRQLLPFRVCGRGDRNGGVIRDLLRRFWLPRCDASTGRPRRLPVEATSAWRLPGASSAITIARHVVAVPRRRPYRSRPDRDERGRPRVNTAANPGSTEPRVHGEFLGRPAFDPKDSADGTGYLLQPRIST
jgi:hypothetical protein